MASDFWMDGLVGVSYASTNYTTILCLNSCCNITYVEFHRHFGFFLALMPNCSCHIFKAQVATAEWWKWLTTLLAASITLATSGKTKPLLIASCSVCPVQPRSLGNSSHSSMAKFMLLTLSWPMQNTCMPHSLIISDRRSEMLAAVCLFDIIDVHSTLAFSCHALVI